MWNIQKLVKKGDYVYAVVPEHPNATKHGYVLHHRVVMENFIGRILTAEEVVHHKDENKKNNDLINLELMTRAEHQKLHASTGIAYVTLMCAECGLEFTKEKRLIAKTTKSPKCSRRCNGLAASKRMWG